MNIEIRIPDNIGLDNSKSIGIFSDIGILNIPTGNVGISDVYCTFNGIIRSVIMKYTDQWCWWWPQFGLCGRLNLARCWSAETRFETDNSPIHCVRHRPEQMRYMGGDRLHTTADWKLAERFTTQCSVLMKEPAMFPFQELRIIP